MFCPKRSRWTPIFLTFLTSLTHHLAMVKCSEKKSIFENFRAMFETRGDFSLKRSGILVVSSAVKNSGLSEGVDDEKSPFKVPFRCTPRTNNRRNTNLFSADFSRTRVESTSARGSLSWTVASNRTYSVLRRNPLENRAISGFSGQKSVPE